MTDQQNEKDPEVQPKESEAKALSQEEHFKLQVRGALDNWSQAPSPEQIEAWKGEYKDVFVSAFSDEEIFIFKSLRRDEYRKLQESLHSQEVDPADYEEKTVKKCLLWTSVEDLSQKAGTIPSLLEQIFTHSNFIPPQMAVQLVAKL